MSGFPLALAILILPPAADPTADYRRLIDEYRISGSARVPEVLAGWPVDTLLEVVALVTPPGSLEDIVHWLEAAALAQLEAGRVALQTRGPGVTARQVDAGRILIDRLRSVIETHRKKSSKLFGGQIRALDSGDTFAVRWLLAGGELLHGTGDLFAAQQHLKLATEIYPRHARLRLGLGTVYELGAVNPALAVIANAGPPGGARQSAQDYRRTLLRSAVDQYETALKLDPSEDEARVRLARVEMLSGRRERPAAMLEAIRASKPSPAMTYLACMLLARMQHQDGNAAQAERFYLDALAAWPDGQRAAVGLSHARWLQGRSVTADFMRRAGDTLRPDPWVVYSLGQLERLNASIADLRKTLWP